MQARKCLQVTWKMLAQVGGQLCCNMHVVCFVSCLRWIDQQQEDLKSNAWITCGSIVEIQPGPSKYTFHGSYPCPLFQVFSGWSRKKDHQEDLMSLLAAPIPTLLPPNGIRVCQGVEVGKQLEPFALLLGLAHLLRHTTHPSSCCKLSKCKEVAWKETLVGQRASPLLLLLAQLEDCKSDKEFYWEEPTNLWMLGNFFLWTEPKSVIA